MEHGRHLRAYIIVLILLMLIAGVAFFMHIGGEVKPATPYVPARGDLPRGFSSAAPTPTPADFTDQQKPFQELVAFNGNSFVPAKLEGNAGDRVRFINNAGVSVVVTTDSTSSPTLKPGEYWQHVYASKGSFEFSYGNIHGTVTLH